MYIIKKITVNGENYQSSKIIEHTNKKITSALILLENCARNFVKEEFGIKSFEQAKILNIHKIDQVCEPIVDGMLLYRLNDDPHRIHVYQRRSEVIDLNGWFSKSKVSQAQFKRTHIFELEEYARLGIGNDFDPISVIPQIEMIPIGSAGIKIPKLMTIGPMVNLFDELKKSDKFKARFETTKS
jgi:hypothetical protein